ncbi:MAG: hypothetical protein ABH835_05215 [Patescibacteria group bacterium]
MIKTMVILAAVAVVAIGFAWMMLRPHLVRAGVIKNSKTSRMDVRNLGDALRATFGIAAGWCAYGALLWLIQEQSGPNSHEWLLDPWMGTSCFVAVFAALWSVPDLVKARNWQDSSIWFPTAVFTLLVGIVTVVWYIRLVVIGLTS